MRMFRSVSLPLLALFPAEFLHMNLLIPQVIKFSRFLLTCFLFRFVVTFSPIKMDPSTIPSGLVVLQLQGPSRAPAILAGNLIPELIATVFFFARVYARAWLLRNWGADDTFLAISWVSDFPPILRHV